MRRYVLFYSIYTIIAFLVFIGLFKCSEPSLSLIGLIGYAAVATGICAIGSIIRDMVLNYE